MNSDPQGSPFYSQTLDCVHCGLCLPSCPTYRQTGKETSSPRGRIYLMRSLAEGRLSPSKAMVRDLDECLVCLACQTACPAGVPYGDMMTFARESIESMPYRSKKARFLKRLFFRRILPSKRSLRLIGQLTSWSRLLRLPSLARTMRLDRWFPQDVIEQEAFLPPSPSFSKRGSPKAVHSPTGDVKARVGLLVGCAAHQLVPEATWASISVLNHLGIEVVCPESQPCCGALASHFGDPEVARDQAYKLRQAFEAYQVDAVLTTAAGCGSAMKDYPLLFSEDSSREFAAFSRRVFDIAEYLAQQERPKPQRALPIRVAYDDPCHLIHGQGIHQAPRNLLSSIPGLELVETHEASHCCGAAGIYGLLQPEMSKNILEQKIDALHTLAPDVIATANPGCLLQIHSGLKRRGLDIRVCHPIELLREAYGLSDHPR